MKEIIKLDKYAVYEKGRVYEVLVFPFIKNMYVYDRTGGDHDRDGCQIDASREAFTYISYAMAILADDSGKLLYFPCRQPRYGGYYYPFTYHMVLCRPKLQFRRSLWTRIRSRQNKKHWRGKYVLRYDREKLYDYFENVLVRKYGYHRQNALGSWAFKIQDGGYDNRKRFMGLIEEEIMIRYFSYPKGFAAMTGTIVLPRRWTMKTGRKTRRLMEYILIKAIYFPTRQFAGSTGKKGKRNEDINFTKGSTGQRKIHMGRNKRFKTLYFIVR